MQPASITVHEPHPFSLLGKNKTKFKSHNYAAKQEAKSADEVAGTLEEKKQEEGV